MTGHTPPWAESIRAVFLDRDGTVAHGSAGRIAARNAELGRLLGVGSFTLTPAVEQQAYQAVMRAPHQPAVTTIQIEGEFWRRWYAAVLRAQGLRGDVDEAAIGLARDFAPWRMLEPYPEAAAVMAAIKRAGYPIGIISDTFPSLESSFQEMGLAEYVDSYTCSAVVGAGKPDPRIYRAALESLGAAPGTSVYVDDDPVKVDGARRVGMAGLNIDRGASVGDPARDVITSLATLLPILGIDPAAAGGDPV